MTQRKKDFTAAAAAAFETRGSVIDDILTPTPAAPAEPTPEAPQLSEKDKATLATLLPQKHLLYTNSSGDEVRVTFMLSTEYYEKLRRLCFAQNCRQKHVVNAALQMYFADYEKKYGKI